MQNIGISDDSTSNDSICIRIFLNPSKGGNIFQSGRGGKLDLISIFQLIKRIIFKKKCPKHIDIFLQKKCRLFCCNTLSDFYFLFLN